MIVPIHKDDEISAPTSYLWANTIATYSLIPERHIHGKIIMLDLQAS